MYDPREDLYGLGPDECQLDDTDRVLLTSQSASPPLTPLISNSFEGDDGLSFPVYESHKRDQGDDSSEDNESTEPSPSPSMVLRPITQVLIERPEDDTAARMLPVRHVDYLSHEWSEEDLWSTWKHIVSERSAYDNSMRLENATWRSWEKTRRKLKTVSPGCVKWMKDHDVTWLYGPLQPGTSLDAPSRSDDNLRRHRRSSSIRHCQKPILKKRSLSELMLRKSVSSASLLRHATTAAEDHTSRNGSFSAHNSFLLTNPALTPPSSFASEVSTPNPNSWKNVRFYELVEQCVAVANPDDDESRFSRDLVDDGMVMRNTSKQIPKQPSPEAPVPKNAPSKTIEKLPHAPLKSPEPQNSVGLGMSYFPVQRAAPPTVEPTSVSFEGDCQGDEDEDWKPPKWLRNRKDSVHLLHNKLEEITRRIGTSPASKPLHDSRLARTSLEKGDTVAVTALTVEGRKSPLSFKLAAFSFTRASDTSPPALSSSSRDEVLVAKSKWSGAVDPAFTLSDYFSPRVSDTVNYDDEYDWIEARELEDVNIEWPSRGDLRSPPPSFPFPAQPPSIYEGLPSHYPTISEKDPIARTSSDSGYGGDHTSVRDTYNGTTEIEKERAVCDWDLYPGAWDAMELEEAVAWSRGF